MRSLLHVTVAAGLLWSTVAGAKTREVRHLQPSSSWVVDYADNSCSLARSFGDGKRRVVMFLEQLQPGDWFHLIFVGDSLSADGTSLGTTVRFGPTEKEQEVSAAAGTTRNKPTIFTDGSQRIAPLTDAEKAARKDAIARRAQFDFEPIGAARENAVTWLELGKVLPFDLVLETGPMDRPLAALRVCSWDMVKSWGFDIEQQKRLSRKPRATKSPYTWLRDDDYPREMLSNGYQSNVNFVLLIDETGKPTSCKIQSSTRPKEFDDVVCRAVMGRARFEPALDAEGRPVRSYFGSSVRFRIASQ